MMRALLLLLIASVLGATGCKRETRVPVARVEASGASHPESALLGLSDEEVRELLSRALQAEGHFELGEAAREKEGAVQVGAQLAFARVVEEGAAPPSTVQVGVTLSVRRQEGPVARHEELDVLVEEPLGGEGQRAARAALQKALEGLSRRASLHLQALRKREGSLVEDLKSGNAQVREAALRALVERRHPAALPAVLEDLRRADPLEARRALGALVTLGDPRAVGPLIDQAKDRDAHFLPEMLYALGAIGGEEAQAYLFTVSRGHDSEAVREVARQALEELNRRGGRKAARPQTGR